MMTQTRHRVFGLDAIRAAAILGVMLSHYSLNYAPIWGLNASGHWFVQSGFFGVELFFALSGFLIGNILFDIAEHGQPSFDTVGRFWMRRWMRTLPCYWIVLFLSVYIEALYGHTNYNLLQFITLTQNLITPYSTDFFGVSWSLVIEEWFYIVFPLALFFALAILPRRGVLACIAAFLIFPAIARYLGFQWLHLDWDAGLRKIVPMQLDAITYGALAALLLRGREVSNRASLVIGLLGAVIVALSWWSLVAPTGFATTVFWVADGRFMSASIGSALLVAAFSSLLTAPRIIAAPTLFLSKHSYTLYLTHLPAFGLVVSFGAYKSAPFLATALGFAASMTLTRLIETPIMRARPAQFKTTEADAKSGILTAIN